MRVLILKCEYFVCEFVRCVSVVRVFWWCLCVLGVCNRVVFDLCVLFFVCVLCVVCECLLCVCDWYDFCVCCVFVVFCILCCVFMCGVCLMCLCGVFVCVLFVSVRELCVW